MKISQQTARLPWVAPSTRVWGEEGGQFTTADLLIRRKEKTEPTTFWRPSNAQDLVRAALEPAAQGLAVAAALSLTVGVTSLASGGGWAELAGRFCLNTGLSLCFLAPASALIGSLLGVCESWNLKMPVSGHLSPAGPEDLVFHSPQLPGPVSLSGYLECCQQALPENPPVSGQFLLQWNGKQAQGSQCALDGESRQAASLVNQAWAKVQRQALKKPEMGECEGISWVGYPDRSLSVRWKSPDGSTDYHARLLTGQDLCSLDIHPNGQEPRTDGV